MTTPVSAAVALTLTWLVAELESRNETPAVTVPTKVPAGIPVPVTVSPRSLALMLASVTVAEPLVTVAVSVRPGPLPGKQFWVAVSHGAGSLVGWSMATVPLAPVGIVNVPLSFEDGKFPVHRAGVPVPEFAGTQFVGLLRK